MPSGTSLTPGSWNHGSGPGAPNSGTISVPEIFTSPGNQKVHLRVPGRSNFFFLVWSNMVRYGHNKVPGRLKTLFGALNDVLGCVLGGPKYPKRSLWGRSQRGPKSRLLGPKIEKFSGVQWASRRVWEVIIPPQTRSRMSKSLPVRSWRAQRRPKWAKVAL